MSGQLQRLVIDFRKEELVVRTLYRTIGGASPNTKARRREVQELTREGLGAALEALEGRVGVVGTSGFTQREDILVALPRPDEAFSLLPATTNICV